MPISVDRLRLMDASNGSTRTDHIIGGGDEENGEIGKKLLSPQEGGSGNRGPGRPGFMVALGNQGLNNLGVLVCWLFLAAGGSGFMGFVEPRVGSQWLGVGVKAWWANEEMYEKPRHWRITLIGPFGSQGICGAVVVKLAKVN